MLINFLHETVKDIEGNGYGIEDIAFIGSIESEESATWSQFCHMADFEYEYVSDYDRIPSHNQIRSDLIITFKDGVSLYREVTNGFEFWCYRGILGDTSNYTELTTVSSMTGILRDKC